MLPACSATYRLMNGLGSAFYFTRQSNVDREPAPKVTIPTAKLVKKGHTMPPIRTYGRMPTLGEVKEYYSRKDVLTFLNYACKKRKVKCGESSQRGIWTNTGICWVMCPLCQ